MSYVGYSTEVPSLELKETTFQRKPISPTDVAVSLTHCGICHTDVHELLNEWATIGGSSKYPMCPGHEAIGTITETGSAVTHLKVGDRVGFGYQRDSCRECEDCKEGWENVCRFGFKGLFSGETGGFASEIVAPAHFAFKIPDSIPSEYAGPLMCAGATVWTPLVNHGLKKGAKVGIMGVGGLGHLALQFASKLGYETAAITRSLDKADAIRGYGATIILDSTNAEQMAQYAGYFDLLLNTVSANIDATAYLQLLKKKGKLIYVGIGDANISVNPFVLIGGNREIGGSIIAGSKDMQDMLQFAAEHNVRPTIEVVKAPFGEGNDGKVVEALKKVQANKMTEFVGYGVLNPSTKIEELTFIAPPLGDDDIAIDVTHCGICHSDIHRLLDEWDTIGLKTHFPLCPGHEVIGVITQVGKNVSLKVGDRVGCGPQRSSNCYRNKLTLCDNCANGEEQLCRNGVEPLYNPKTGGFGSELRISERFAFKIPEEIPSHVAGPLLCAGLTVYSPIVHANLRPGAKVAVVGIGGLGHMALMYMNAMGYEVSAISRSVDKFDMIKSYGATHIINSTNDEEMKKFQGYFDFILNTIAAPVPADQYLSLLKTRGKLTYVGLGCDNIMVNPFSLIGGNKSICGSYIGGSKDMEDMLAFSAKHKIFPTVEVVEAPFGQNNADKVSGAVAKVINNTVRFRMVLDYKKQ